MASHILFDFFGTLVTYAPDGPDHDFGRSHRLLQSMGSALGYDQYRALWSGVYSGFDGEACRTGREFSMREVTAEFLRQATGSQPSAGQAAALACSYLADWDACVRYLPGLKDMLASLSRRYKLAVVSNTNDTSLVPAHLNAMGVLEYFDAVILSAQIGWRKPHPAIFTATQETLGIGPGDAVFVGDSYLPDYQGPSRAGITAFLIDPGHLAEVPDHARLASLFELPAALDSNRNLSARAQITRSASHLRPEPRPAAPTQIGGS